MQPVAPAIVRLADDPRRDASLIARAEGGCQAAFADLWRIHYGDVWAKAQRHTGCGETAHDVAAEAFADFWTAVTAGRVRGERPIGYLHAIARNKARRARRGLRAAAMLFADLDDAIERPLAADEACLGNDLRAAVEAALPRLTEVQQRAVRAVLAGETVAQVARSTGRAPAACRTALDEATKRLAEILVTPARRSSGRPQQRTPIMTEVVREIRREHPDWTFGRVACEGWRRAGQPVSRSLFAGAHP